MTTTAQSTCILVDLKDADGYDNGRSIPVFVDYIVSVDHSYGEDADGQHGTTLVEYDILDVWIELSDLLTMNSAEVEQSLADARIIFTQRQKHY